jgi:lipoprotein
MKNIIKYILISLVCLISVGCGQDTPNPVVYESPLSKVVDARNTDIINKFNNAVEITVKYDMDKETDSFVDESIKDMEYKGYLVSSRKIIESTRILSTTPDVLHTVVEYQIITYKKEN